MYSLRWYQQEAIDALFNFFWNNLTGNPVIAMPTGTGKSIVIAEFCRIVLTQWPNQQILMLTHVKELISQNTEKLLNLWPAAPVGIFSAGLNRKEHYLPIVFGGVQSVVNLLQKDSFAFGRRDLVIIDECHLLSVKDTSQYQTVLAKLREVNPHLRVIGLTATPYRLKTGTITDGEGLFDAMAYDLCAPHQFERLLEEGHLSPLIPKRPMTAVEMKNVRVVAGEYNLKDLDEAIGQDTIRGACREMCEYGWDRKSWLVFAAGIEKAEEIAEMLQSFGIDAAASHSKLSIEENNQRIQAFKDGRLRALVNNNKLTTGFDHPGIDLIGMLRPTLSPGLWVQMLGRGTRPAPGKQNCLVLDFAGNTARLGPINDPVIPGKPRKGAPGEAPVKICEPCGCYNHCSARLCAICGAEFIFQNKLTAQASEQELMKLSETILVPQTLDLPQRELKEFDVSHVMYHKHQKNVPGSKPCLQVTYIVNGMQRFKEWVFFSHYGDNRTRAVAWWLRRANGLPTPANTEEAYANATKLKMPSKILVSIGGKYPMIVDAQII